MQDDMKFANRMEAMAFNQSGWHIIEESADGNTIYMGKSMVPDADENDPVWAIKKTTISLRGDGKRVTVIKYAEGCRNRWSQKETLEYLY